MHYFLSSSLSVYLYSVYIMLLLLIKGNFHTQFLLYHFTGNPPYVWSHNNQRTGSGSGELNLKRAQQLHWCQRMVKLNNDGD
jgi:hypothetical protein